MGGKGNEGVAGYVKRLSGAIGHVEYAYALKNGIPHVLLQNKAGKFVAPTIETFQAAAEYADRSKAPGFYMVLTDQPGARSWPITGATFILLHKTLPDARKAKATRPACRDPTRRSFTGAAPSSTSLIPSRTTGPIRGISSETMNGFLRAIAPPAVGLALVVLAAACPPKIPPFDPGTVRADKLPRHVPTLLKFARKRLARGRAQGGFHRLYFADAVIALDKARGLAPKHREVLLLGAQTSRALGERARTGPEQFKYAELGLTFTRAGRQHFGKQAVFHYYHAALLGLRVDAYRASAFSGVPEIRKAAERAIALDRRVDSAGPLRVLGSLLASVPATAPFHGDVEKGTALLEQAVKLSPDHPLNHYFLAQAYAKDDETAQATRHYHRVLCTQIGGTWDKVLATKCRARTIKALRELKQSTAPKCP